MNIPLNPEQKRLVAASGIDLDAAEIAVLLSWLLERQGKVRVDAGWRETEEGYRFSEWWSVGNHDADTLEEAVKRAVITELCS